MGKINLLHIITKLELGGAQQNVLSILESLNKEEYNPFLISAREGILVKDALSLKGAEVNLIKSLRSQINLFFDCLAIYEIYRYIKKNKINIVHTHSSKAGILGRWAARFAGVPVIIHTIHGWGFHEHQNFFSHSLYVFLEKITAKITAKLIAVSERDINTGLSKGIGSAEKYFLIRYGIKKGYFLKSQDPVSKRKELGLRPDSLIVGMVACFKPQKSPLDFIRVACLVSRINPQAEFILVGDGRLRNKIIGSIRKSGLENNVVLLGWRRDIPEIMAILDLLVLTSRWEGLPIVFLEAMASSKPIVATSVGGASEVIRDGENGFLASPGDIQTISNRILQLLKDESLRQRMGKQGRAFLGTDFDQEVMNNRMNHLYASLA